MNVTYMSYQQLKNVFRLAERGNYHIDGCITFTADSFTEEYSEESRTYKTSSDNKAFQSGKIGYAIYGSSLDETDYGVRLEAYMAAERGGRDGWQVENCYIKNDELAKLKAHLQNNGHSGLLDLLSEVLEEEMEI